MAIFTQASSPILNSGRRDSFMVSLCYNIYLCVVLIVQYPFSEAKPRCKCNANARKIRSKTERIKEFRSGNALCGCRHFGSLSLLRLLLHLLGSLLGLVGSLVGLLPSALLQLLSLGCGIALGLLGLGGQVVLDLLGLGSGVVLGVLGLGVQVTLGLLRLVGEVAAGLLGLIGNGGCKMLVSVEGCNKTFV